MKKLLKVQGLYTGDIYRIDALGEAIRKRNTVIRTPNTISLVKEKAYLLYLCEHAYVDIDKIKSYYTYLRAANVLYEDGTFPIHNEMIVTDFQHIQELHSLLIKKDSLKKFRCADFKEEMTYKELRLLKQRIEYEKKEL